MTSIAEVILFYLCLHLSSSSLPFTRGESLMSALKVAFEGLPGSGKTTAIEGVVRDLTEQRFNVDVVDIETIGHAPELRQITREYPLGHRARIMLFWILRLQQYETINANNNDRDVIIADRFWGSTLAFDGYGNRVPKEVLDWVGEGVHIQPDLTLFFDAPLSVVKQRKKATTLQNPEFAKRVAMGYRRLADEYGWVNIDATQDIETVRVEAINHILGELAIKSANSSSNV
jgi:thymidylate kinase